MEFAAYARIVATRWRLIVALVLVAGGVAFAANSQAPTTYRATASLSVTPSIVEYWTGQAVERLLNNYALQIRSRPFSQIVARAVGLPEDALIGRIRSIAAPAEFRLSIEVDDDDADRAVAIANQAGTAFVTKIRTEIAGRERQDIRLDILEPAVRPDGPISPRPLRAGAGGALAGAVVGLGLTLLLTFWDGRVHTVGEATRVWGRPALGAIPVGALLPRTLVTGKQGVEPTTARRRGALSGASPL